MESVAPISDMITGTVLYNKLVEGIISEQAELTLTEYRILFFLAQATDEQARIHTLAEALILSTSTVSDAVKDMEAAGLVRKAGSENDLKAIWAVITEDGRQTFDRYNDAILRGTQDYWSIVGADVKEKYFSFVTMLIRRGDYLSEAAFELPGPVFYSFASRRYLLSHVSWFKSTYNLSLIEARILMLLFEWDEKLTCTDIAYLLKVSNSTVSNAVRNLSRIKKYVKRSRAQSNHEIEIELTDEGADRIREIRERFIRIDREQFGLTREEFMNMLSTTYPRKQKNTIQKVFGDDFIKP